MAASCPILHRVTDTVRSLPATTCSRTRTGRSRRTSSAPSASPVWSPRPPRMMTCPTRGAVGPTRASPPSGRWCPFGCAAGQRRGSRCRRQGTRSTTSPASTGGALSPLPRAADRRPCWAAGTESPGAFRTWSGLSDGMQAGVRGTFGAARRPQPPRLSFLSGRLRSGSRPRVGFLHLHRFRLARPPCPVGSGDCSRASSVSVAGHCRQRSGSSPGVTRPRSSTPASAPGTGSTSTSSCRQAGDASCYRLWVSSGNREVLLVWRSRVGVGSPSRLPVCLCIVRGPRGRRSTPGRLRTVPRAPARIRIRRCTADCGCFRIRRSWGPTAASEVFFPKEKGFPQQPSSADPSIVFLSGRTAPWTLA